MIDDAHVDQIPASHDAHLIFANLKQSVAEPGLGY